MKENIITHPYAEPSRPRLGFLAWLIPVLLLALVGAGILYRVATRPLPEEEGPAPLPVVEVIDLDAYRAAHAGIPATGTLRSSAEADIAAEASGRILRVAVELGEAVTRGQALVMLDDSDLDARLAQAQAGIDRQAASLAAAKAGATDEQIRQAEAAVASARAALDQARTQLATAEAGGVTGVEQAELGVDAARTALENATESGNLQVASATESGALAARDASAAARDALLALTDIQERTLYCTDQNCLGVARAKELAVRALFDQANAGRWIASEIAELDGGAIGRAESVDPSATSGEELVSAMADLQAGIESLRDALSVTEVALTQPGVSPGPGDAAVIDGARLSMEGTLARLSGSQQALDGALLARDASVEGARTALSQAELGLESARTNGGSAVESAQALVKISEAGVEQAIAGLAAAKAGPRAVDLGPLEASVREARAAYAQIAAARDKAAVRAPFDGTISKLYAAEGELASPGAPVATITSPDVLEAVLHVSERDRALLRLGAKVRAEGAEGIVTRIAPSIDPATGKIEVRAVFDDPGALVAGSFVNAEIDATEALAARGAYFLPLEAVRPTGDGHATALAIAGDSVLRTVDIEIGKVVAERVEVLGGLSADDRVIASARGRSAGERVEAR